MDLYLYCMCVRVLNTPLLQPKWFSGSKWLAPGWHTSHLSPVTSSLHTHAPESGWHEPLTLPIGSHAQGWHLVKKKKNHEDVSNSSQSLIHPCLLLAVWKKTQHSWSYCKCYCLRVGGRPEIEKDDAWVCKCSTITVCVCICVSERCWFFTLTLWGRPSLPSILPAITL